MSDEASSTSTAVSQSGYPRQTPLLYFELSVFWFAIAFIWAGMITIFMQERVLEMVGKRLCDLYLCWAIGLGAFVSTVVCLVVGTMSDRSRWRIGKRRPYMIVGSLLSVPFLLWMADVHSIPMLMLVFCLIQLWVNVATSPYQALMPDTVPKERQGTASAYMGMNDILGTIGGLILCGLLYSRPHGPQTIMIVLSAVLVVMMLWVVLRVPQRSAADNPAPQLGLLATLIESFRVSPRQYPDFFWLIGSRFMINLGFYTATFFLLYYLTFTLHVKHADQAVMLVGICIIAAGLVGNFPAGVLSDRVSKKLVVYLSALIAGVAGLIFVIAGSITTALIAGGVFGVGFGAFKAVDWAFATNLLPDRDEAKYMGVWHVAFTAPQVVAPLIGGPLIFLLKQHMDSGDAYRVVFFTVIIYFAIGTLLIRPIRERRINQSKG